MVDKMITPSERPEIRKESDAVWFPVVLDHELPEALLSTLDSLNKVLSTMRWSQWSSKDFFAQSVNEVFAKQGLAVSLTVQNDKLVLLNSSGDLSLARKALNILKPLTVPNDVDADSIPDNLGALMAAIKPSTAEKAEWSILSVEQDISPDLLKLSQASVSELIQAERNNPWTLLKIFAFGEDWRALKFDSIKDLVNRKITFSFRGNSIAEKRIWLSDMLEPAAKRVEVTKSGVAQEGLRQGIKWWFFTQWAKYNDYLEVLDGYTLTIKELYTPEELEIAQGKSKEQFLAFTNLTQDPRIKALYIRDGKIDERLQQVLIEIWQVAIEYGNEPSVEDVLKVVRWCGGDLAQTNSADIVSAFRAAQIIKNDPEWASSSKLTWFVNLESITDPALKQKLKDIADKPLSLMNFEDAKTLFLWVFWTGPWTDLAVRLSNGSPALLLRTIATAKHEGGLKFGLTNPDKAKNQKNIWTFQISEAFEKGNVMRKYFYKSLVAWLELAWNPVSINPVLEKYNNEVSNADAGNYGELTSRMMSEIQSLGISYAQQDLLTWYWYINLSQWGARTFAKLADSSLSEPEVMTLISDKIQVWIPAIWASVVAQIKSQSVGDYVRG